MTLSRQYFRHLTSLLSALKSDVDDKLNGKAAGLLKSPGKFEFVAITHYAMDVLVILNRLSLSLQASNLTHADLILLLETTKQSLLNLKEGFHLEEFQESLADSPDVLCELGGPNTTYLYKGLELSINKTSASTRIFYQHSSWQHKWEV